jgi:nitroimidazol reductase NimA-like FMN-containing flavoprotein (pyridoxamine 5'-phosphate oxidase superfamily)
MLRNSREVQEFMNRERLAGFVTVDSKNRPHVVPVFFTYKDGKVYVQTDQHSVKVRNLLRNNNVAVAVYRGEEAVIIRGKGRIIDSSKEFIKRTQEHIDKYKLKLDEGGRDSLGIPLFNKKIRCIVEVAPERIVFW